MPEITANVDDDDENRTQRKYKKHFINTVSYQVSRLVFVNLVFHIAPRGPQARVSC